jgi:hypothetical protein
VCVCVGVSYAHSSPPLVIVSIITHQYYIPSEYTLSCVCATTWGCNSGLLIILCQRLLTIHGYMYITVASSDFTVYKHAV